jgi:hypothetical protein
MHQRVNAPALTPLSMRAIGLAKNVGGAKAGYAKAV